MHFYRYFQPLVKSAYTWWQRTLTLPMISMQSLQLPCRFFIQSSHTLSVRDCFGREVRHLATKTGSASIPTFDWLQFLFPVHLHFSATREWQHRASRSVKCRSTTWLANEMDTTLDISCVCLLYRLRSIWSLSQLLLYLTLKLHAK